MEWEFSETEDGAGSFVATGKVVGHLRNHLARGELDEALTLYESCAENVGDDLLAEFPSASTRLQKAMANLFFRARDYKRAAHACEQLSEWAAAAKSYEAAYAYTEAANCYVRAKRPDKAAAVYQKAGHYEKAAALFRAAQDFNGAAQAMGMGGDPLGAAELLMDANDPKNAARWLAAVSSDSPSYSKAVLRLADVLTEMGRVDVAIQRLATALPKKGEIENDDQAAVAYRLGEAFEAAGRDQEASQVYSLIRRFDPNFKDVSRRKASTPPPSPSLSPTNPPDDPFASLDSPKGRAPSVARASLSNIGVAAGSAAGELVTRMEDYDLLKTLPFFESLSLDELKDFYHLFEQVEFAPGRVVIEQGHPGEALFIIREGELTISVMDDGKENEVATAGHGQFVGDMALIDDGPTSARVTAKTNVRAFRIGKAAFQRYLYANDLVALRIYKTFTRTLTQRLRLANEKS